MGWFVLADSSLREGIFGGIEWSGAWQLTISREQGNTWLNAGIGEIHHSLAPGEIFQSPGGSSVFIAAI